MTDDYVHSFTAMGTVVTIQVIGHGESPSRRRERAAVVRRAAAWFDHVERTCSRFDPTSEVSQLATRVGEVTRVSDLLFETVRFAIAVATDSHGAFDPTVGRRMEARGFDQEHRSEGTVRTNIDESAMVTYLDIHLDELARTITLHRPLLLDFGGVAKGMAIDLAVRELAPFRNFAIDAGGDLYLAGNNASGRSWSVGIRHPRDANEMIDTVYLSDIAVCTSGDYERVSRLDRISHHLMDPETGRPASASSSVTVIAPLAMLADALATAAFVLGPDRGIALLERHDVDGMIVTPALQRFATAGLASFREPVGPMARHDR